MIFQVTITGSGTQREIINALKTVIKTVEGCSTEELVDFENENPTLFTAIKTLEDESEEET